MKKENTSRWRRVRRIVSAFAAVAGVGYLLLLTFPQPLFAYATDYGKFRVYSREPIPQEINGVLDAAEERLKDSPIYDADVRRNVYLTGSFRMYAFLSHKAYNSFANSVPLINNIFINKTDVPADQVIMNREFRHSRSLSGVIAHETAHLFIRNRYGTLSASLMPTWKNEGYCEYIARDTTMPIEEGIRRWRENPDDDTGYRFIKYQLMVRHLLENESVPVEDLFTKTFDEKAVAERTFTALQ